MNQNEEGEVVACQDSVAGQIELTPRVPLRVRYSPLFFRFFRYYYYYYYYYLYYYYTYYEYYMYYYYYYYCYYY